VLCSLRPMRRMRACAFVTRGALLQGCTWTLRYDAHRSLLGSCVAREGASLCNCFAKRGRHHEGALLSSRLAAAQKTSQKVMAMAAALEAEERKEAAAATAAHTRRATPLRTKLERRAAAIRARDEVRPAHPALAPVMLQS